MDAKLREILDKHAQWARNGQGRQANLIGAELSGAYLIGANLREANLREAELGEANLRGANLSGAYLIGANLSEADLRRADLREANLSEANLSEAYLIGADLREANLSEAELRGANLIGANLIGANLSGANLSGADLREAELSRANLIEANLSGANLRSVKNLDPLVAARLSITPEGDVIGWKRCLHGVLVKLLIPAAAKRSNATSRKCRAEYATVLEVIGARKGYSLRNGTTVYRVGKTVHCHEWCEDRWQECAGGIHFYLTREEADAHR